MRILIVDDHALVRRGLNYVVKEGFPDADVVEAESSAVALEVLHAGTAFDLALVDVRMPDLDGLELLRAIRAEWADMPVIMISTYENAPYVKRALADGAAGYLLKDATPEDLAQAINVAMSGSGNVLSPRVIQNLFDDQDSSVGSNGHSRRNEYSLTQREHDILGGRRPHERVHLACRGLFAAAGVGDAAKRVCGDAERTREERPVAPVRRCGRAPFDRERGDRIVAA